MTFYRGYANPNAIYWDENYHIASAQKYIDGAMFMESHPPLGKMLLALGEVIVGKNADLDKSALIKTDYIKGEELPKGFTFSGFRLMSALLMTLSVPFFFWILYYLTKNPHLSLLFCSLLLFDNALIMHTRGAMLEGIQLFFMLVAIWYLVRAISSGIIRLQDYAILGIFVGLAISVKLNGAVLLMLFVFLYAYDHREAIKNWQIVHLVKRLLITIPVSVIPIILVFCFIFYLHIANGTKITKGTYKASEHYVELIKKGETTSLDAFVTGLKDNLHYIATYAEGVPRLDPCKKGENGSHATGWPLGKKSINYRWSKNTEDGVTKVKYLYLQSNPIIWLSVFAGIFLGVILVVGRAVYGTPVKDWRLFWWIAAFSGIYLSYMMAILQIERVMYLYHYFMPLLFAMINLVLVFAYVFKEELAQKSWHTYLNAGFFVLLIILTYWHFSPLTYYLPLSGDEFHLRQWFEFWQLEAIR